MPRFVHALVSTLVASLQLAGVAHAQSASGLQMTPDSRRYLISKDVGAERWAISFNLNDRTVTGNVFKTDGSAPSFIWCRITSETPNAEPRQTSYTLDCSGADACAAAPCTSDGWKEIASGLVISGDFLLPKETRATFRGAVQPIFTARCALSGCHAGADPQEGLNLEEGQAYDDIFLVLEGSGAAAAAAAVVPPLRPAHDGEHYEIEPFDPSTSHLFLKIRGEEEGERMPLGGPYLDETQENAIRDWILEGAADN
ncbi:hypothetical protein K2Z84_19570 [Candidatus Binatia bacterium]|nr:hypothetical protein [Candidatus Binatia bacterium]